MKKQKEKEERLNPMKLLENRTKASRREMENLEALEDLKEMNQREVVIDYDELLRKKQEEVQAAQLKLKEEEELEEAEFVKSIYENVKQLKEGYDNDNSDEDEIIEEFDLTYIYSLKGQNNNDFLKNEDKIQASTTSSTSSYTDILSEEINDYKSLNSTSSSFSSTTNILPLNTASTNNNSKRKLLENIKIIKRKAVSDSNSNSPKSKNLTESAKPDQPSASGTLSSLCTYSDSDSE